MIAPSINYQNSIPPLCSIIRRKSGREQKFINALLIPRIKANPFCFWRFFYEIVQSDNNLFNCLVLF